ncbi:sulfite oxidase [Nitrosococcus wardiae]|uniref:Molybdopterin containing oxidoreductase n=1 Tax=Nitrosococcus wardiae TaxID=1814290 RepID=A0A4P7C1M2_9GAMM|nr:sulfite oxidase [Nitrosococcus wardiae]QBQ55537.1 molybdopterin containing oxidoreductase [Nitrosococcus wardiae]
MEQGKRIKKGIHELYATDPLEADKMLWGREVNPFTRRGFLKKSALFAMSAVLGAHIPFWRNMPGGLIPVVLADSTEPFQLPGKHPDLVILNDRPVNAETPAHLLDDPITPADKLFVRNNGIPPQDIDINHWTLTITGESAKKTVSYTLEELKTKFKNYTYQLTLECGGNGRSEFHPPAPGNQWTVGAVGSPEWTGVRLGEVLKSAGIEEDAIYIGYYGKDTHLSGTPHKVPISRGVPISKALEPHSLIAWAINGEDLPLLNGYPLRLVCPGWPASTSGKWLEKIVIRNQIHDGTKMGGYSYRVPCHPVAPGAKVPEEEMCIIESMPVKSIITSPRSGAMLKLGQYLKLRGHAWAGDLSVSAMEVSIDFGATWQHCSLRAPKNPYAWQHWETTINFPERGYYEVWARATDDNGKMQPMLVPGWNPKGYLNNACHRIAVKIL